MIVEATFIFMFITIIELNRKFAIIFLKKKEKNELFLTLQRPLHYIFYIKRTGRMQDSMDTGQDGCKKGQVQDRTGAGQNKSDSGQEDAVQDVCRK